MFYVQNVCGACWIIALVAGHKLQVESHPFLPQKQLLKYLKANNIVLTAVCFSSYSSVPLCRRLYVNLCLVLLRMPVCVCLRLRRLKHACYAYL